MVQCIGGEFRDFFHRILISNLQGEPITTFIHDKMVLIEFFLTSYSQLENCVNSLEFYINSVTYMVVLKQNSFRLKLWRR